jgi:hypothetical protein
LAKYGIVESCLLDPLHCFFGKSQVFLFIIGLSKVSNTLRQFDILSNKLFDLSVNDFSTAIAVYSESSCFFNEVI